MPRALPGASDQSWTLHNSHTGSTTHANQLLPQAVTQSPQLQISFLLFPPTADTGLSYRATFPPAPLYPGLELGNPCTRGLFFGTVRGGSSFPQGCCSYPAEERNA